MSRRGATVVFRDMVIFILGVLIISRQAGIFFAPPPDVSVELLFVGALMSNVPGILHVIAWRSGVATGSPFSASDLPQPPSPPVPPVTPSLGGEG